MCLFYSLIDGAVVKVLNMLKKIITISVSYKELLFLIYVFAFFIRLFICLIVITHKYFKMLLKYNLKTKTKT